MHDRPGTFLVLVEVEEVAQGQLDTFKLVPLRWNIAVIPASEVDMSHLALLDNNCTRFVHLLYK